MILLILGVLLFAGVHFIPARMELRAAAVARLGEGPYKGLFSLAILAGIALMAIGYGAARAAGPLVLWDPPAEMRHVVMMLMAPVFPLLFAGNVDGVIKAKLKHPMLAAVKLWAAGHLLANGTLPDLILFGGILAWAVLARISLKRRGKAGGTDTPKASADIIPVVAGLVLYVLFGWKLHLWLIGMPLT